jgi:hypothetical protein
VEHRCEHGTCHPPTATAFRHYGKQANRQTGKQANRQTGKQANMQTDHTQGKDKNSKTTKISKSIRQQNNKQPTPTGLLTDKSMPLPNRIMEAAQEIDSD